MQGCHRRLFLLLIVSLVVGGCAYNNDNPARASLVVENAFVFSMETGQKVPFIGYLAVGDDGRIVQIGEGKSPAAFVDVKHVDAAGMWMLPGFVSSHSHLWQSAFSGIAPDENLEGWIRQLYGVEAPRLDAAALYRLTVRGGLHHLRNGITSAFNFTFTGADASGAVDRCQLRGALDSGIRVVHGLNIRAIGPNWTPHQAEIRTAAFLRWADSQRNDDRYFATMIAGAGIYSDSPAQINVEADLMRKFALGNQQHYLESPAAAAVERARYQWMKDAGMVNKKLILGHFVHASTDIIEDVARAGGAMTWNPLSNGRLGSGTPDIPDYLRRGLRIGMGVDGEASADRADPFENMRMGLYQIRALRQQAGALGAYEILKLHTAGSAEVLGLGSHIGSLEVSKYADFLLIEPDAFTPYQDPYAALVFAAGVEHLHSVYSGGRRVVMQGRVVAPREALSDTVCN